MVTTSHKPNRQQVLRALEVADKLGVRYISRRHLVQRKDEAIVIVESDKISAVKDGKRFFFHPSLAVIRKSNVDSGQKDHLLEALDLKGNERVLDCTLGLGSEAILMAHFLPNGIVVGIEKSPLISLIVEEGMKRKDKLYKWIAEAIERIKIVQADYKEFIRKSSEKFDCVYVDPMFEHPSYDSSAMNSMRPFTDNSNVSVEDIEIMKKIAKKRVVVKAKWNDSIFDRYDFDEVIGSAKSGIGYGVIKI
ncbi:class I SAM-dependent methyltransferase [Mesoaciditoga sp.]